MGKIKDLTGIKFGRLTVIGLDVNKNMELRNQGKYKVHWICECECGNTKSINGSSLKKGSTKSCGCLNKELAKERVFKDITGMKFGRLTVEKISYKSESGRVYWDCVCDCGNKAIVSSYNLTSGKTQSCDCYRRERVRESLLNDLTDQRFGRLIATNLSHTNNQRTYWNCLCDCGNYSVVDYGNLVSGTTQSCGCLLKESRSSIKNNLIGRKFGRLTVKEISEIRTSGDKIMYLCDCDCGTKNKSIGYSNLTSGNTISCGCYGREMVSGVNSHLWKGGITETSHYLRSVLNDWKMDSLKNNDFKCCISGSNKNLIVHHTTPFNSILKETFKELSIDIKGKVSDYDDEELKLLKDKFIENHYRYGLGAVVTKDLHMEFHNNYGRGNNGNEFTAKDWLEFYNNKLKIEK